MTTKEKILEILVGVYTKDSGLMELVSRGLDKMTKTELDGLLLLLEVEKPKEENRSVWDCCQEAIAKYGTKDNSYEMFPVGTRVRVITPCQDFNFFFNEPTGTIVKNGGSYLGILVKWDNPRHFESGYVEEAFNFEPQDLILEEKNEKT